MKRFILLFVIVASLLLCASCTDEDTYNKGYNDGYFEGRDWGQKQIAYHIEDQYSDIYSKELDDAISILNIYADGIYEDEFGEPISEDDLQRAIQLLLEYRCDVEELIYNIDEIEVY